jgi:hypothetical protein
MPLVILLLVLFALLAFIVWERRRPSVPLSRERTAVGWSPRVLLRWPALAGIFVCTVALGVTEWISPTQPPFTGRLSSLMSLAYEHFGPRGLAFVWFGFAAPLGLAAFASWLASGEIWVANERAER